MQALTVPLAESCGVSIASGPSTGWQWRRIASDAQLEGTAGNFLAMAASVCQTAASAPLWGGGGSQPLLDMAYGSPPTLHALRVPGDPR